MAYEIRSSDGTLVSKVSDGTVDQSSTSIGFIGRRYSDFGLIFNENQMHLLESFANESPPQNPVTGQVWFDKSPGINSLKVYVNDTIGWKILNYTADLTSSTVSDNISFTGTTQFFNDVTVEDGATTTFKETVTFDTINVVFTDSVITGNPSVNSNITFNGSATFNDTAIFNSSFTFGDSITFDNVATFNNTANFNGTIQVSSSSTTINGSTIDLVGTSLSLDSGSPLTLSDGTYIELTRSTSDPLTPSTDLLRVYSKNSEGNDSTTVLYLSFAGAQGSTTITDSSAGTIANGGSEPNNTVTAFGNASIDRYVRIGVASLNLDGTGDYVTATDNTNYDFGTGEFTIDCWIHPTSVTVEQTIFSKGTSATDRFELIVTTSSTLQFLFDDGTSSINISGGTLKPNEWNHVVIERVNPDTTSDFNIYINGSRVATTNVTGATYDFDVITGDFEIGRRAYGTFEYFNGHMDELRVVKSVAKYQAGFQPRKNFIGVTVPAFIGNDGTKYRLLSELHVW